MIVLEELESRFTTNEDLTIELKAINLAINSGDCIGIIGKSNSEKTALIRTLACLDQPTAGTIQFEDHSINKLDKSQINQIKQYISFIDKGKSLLESKSVFENIALPLILQQVSHDEIERKINILSEELQLADKLPLKPQQLSNVARTIVCLARALITAPKLLICDDITSGLELKNSLNLAKILQKIKFNNNIAIILATNDLELIKTACNKVLILDKATIIENIATEKFILCPQSYIGKEFIKAKSRLELPTSIRKNLASEPNNDLAKNTIIVRCCFNENINAEISITEIIEKLNLKINILTAHQETIDKTKLNFMLLEITGINEKIIEATTQLNQKELFTEALGYVK